ncbi:uncharacterized protein [Nicotiana tomentosiformis]|uniref:uncharacterized protein n=1 Tax=Nicotiana tomentosiformis TaxID=4098 RepID=UPI00388C8DCD
MTKSFSISVPLVEALEQMSVYSKFMKDIVTKKHSMNFETIKVIHQIEKLPMRFQLFLRDISLIWERLFVMLKMENLHSSNEVCSFVHLVTDVTVDDTRAMINVGDILEAVLLNFDNDEMDGFMECVNSLQEMGSYYYAPRIMSLDHENRTTPPTKPFIEEPPTLELKPLSPHLRYKFLDPCSTLSVILSSCLTNVQVDSTLAVLQKRKKAIGWTLVDIWGISPTFFMHKIKLEEGAKPSIEHQRRLNEAIQEVVKKEIIKWLDAGVVYPISDSLWTSPVQCVPKKRGMTIRGLLQFNDKNELIPTRKIGRMLFIAFLMGIRATTKSLLLRRIKRKQPLHVPMVVNPLCKLLEKDTKFNFNDDCMIAFELLNFKLTTTLIITAPNWSVLLEFMYDATDAAVGAVSGQRINKIFHPFYYASKTMNSCQVDYTIMDKELLAIVFAIEKFRPYLMGAKVIVHTNHAVLRYLMRK